MISLGKLMAGELTVRVIHYTIRISLRSFVMAYSAQ